MDTPNEARGWRRRRRRRRVGRTGARFPSGAVSEGVPDVETEKVDVQDVELSVAGVTDSDGEAGEPPETENQAESEPDVAEPGPEVESGTRAEAEDETVTESEPVARTEVETEAEADAEVAPDAETEPVAQAEDLAENEAEPDPAAGVEPVAAETPAETAAAGQREQNEDTPAPANAVTPPPVPEEAVDDYGSDDVRSWVRPYVWTGGRTQTSIEFELETLVSARESAQQSGDVVRDEHRRVLEICEQPRSVSEVAALLSVPLGVAKTLVGSMAEEDMLRVHRGRATSSGPDLELMERVLRGLKNL